MGIKSSEVMTVNEVSVYGNNELGELTPRLENIRLTIGPGEWISIVGVNGSGKSTVARLLAGLQPEGLIGQVQRGFAGEGCSSIVLQQPRAQLFGETPREEVIFALEWKGIAAEGIPMLVEQALARAGLLEVADEPWDRLSGGQQQLAAIAASTAIEAPLIVLDEVTSMLDETNADLVMHRARALHKSGTAVVWVTQRLNELERDSRVVAIGNGAIIYDGDAAEFLYGSGGETSPCEQCGLRLPYMAKLAIELRGLGYLLDPLPMSSEQWRWIMRGLHFASSKGAFNDEMVMDKGSRLESKVGVSDLLLDGIKWRSSGDKEEEVRTAGLRIRQDAITVLIGPNGAGKTTLLEKIAGLRSPEGLVITYGSERLWKEGRFGKNFLNSEAISQYSYACQLPEEGLFARSVQEELSYSLRPYSLSEGEREEQIAAALSAVGWDQSWLTRDPYLMSGGERRRAALASVFVTPSRWLLLDEPTAGLDGNGHDLIAAQLTKARLDGSGVLLVSHDSDWALPLADYVLIMSVDGSVRMCTRGELLAYPKFLAESGIHIPDWLETAHLLWRSGVSSEQVWKPATAASGFLKAGGSLGKTGVLTEEPLTSDSAWGQNENTSEGKDKDKPFLLKVREQTKQHRLTRFDPRSVWLAYIFISTGLFLLTSWTAVALGGAVVATLLIAGNVSLRRWHGLLINYAVFSIVTSAIFALGAGSGSDHGGWINVQSFVWTLFTFVRTMLVLLLGLAIPLVMTPLALRRSLTQMISVRGRSPQWAQRFILMVALMLRFIPVLLSLWERFLRIFLARGKSMSRKPWLAIRRLRDVSLPFLLALFRLADEVTLALESRGVGLHQSPTQAMRLKWGVRDYGLVVGALVIGWGLWVLKSL